MSSLVEHVDFTFLVAELALQQTLQCRGPAELGPKHAASKVSVQRQTMVHFGTDCLGSCIFNGEIYYEAELDVFFIC